MAQISGKTVSEARVRISALHARIRNYPSQLGGSEAHTSHTLSPFNTQLSILFHYALTGDLFVLKIICSLFFFILTIQV